MGPSIKYVTLFLANFDSLPPVTLCHTFRDPPKYTTHLGPPRFLVGLVQKPGQKPPAQNLSQVFAGAFVKGSFVWKVLCGVIFVHSPSVRIHLYNRKLKITLNFMFHMYDKF